MVNRTLELNFHTKQLNKNSIVQGIYKKSEVIVKKILKMAKKLQWNLTIASCIRLETKFYRIS